MLTELVIIQVYLDPIRPSCSLVICFCLYKGSLKIFHFRYKGPFNCPKCEKQFTRRFNLQLHLQKGCAKKKRNSYWPANREEYEEYGE